MQRIIAAAAAAVILAGAVAARAEDNAAILAPVHGFLDATDKAPDIDKAASYWTPSQSVVDEFAPYHWTGPKALRAWWAGFLEQNKKTGATDAVMTPDGPPRVEQTGRHAYVVQRASFGFKVKGQAMRLDGALTFALDRTKAGWKIAAFAWAGEKLTP